MLLSIPKDIAPIPVPIEFWPMIILAPVDVAHEFQPKITEPPGVVSQLFIPITTPRSLEEIQEELPIKI